MSFVSKFQYFFICNLLVLTEVSASPGGSIAKAAVNTTWGRIGMLVLFIILSPLVLYVYLKESKAKKRTLKDLDYLSRQEGALEFDWLKMKPRLYDCFVRVHSAWDKEDVSEASKWMTSWFWQNQQIGVLDKWARDGLKNVCEVHQKVEFKPLLFVHRNENGIPHAGSTVHVLASAIMTDYLVEKASGKVVEGCKSKKEVIKMWSFALVNGQWVVDNIEDESLSLDYADIAKTLPAIEETLLSLRKVS